MLRISLQFFADVGTIDISDEIIEIPTDGYVEPEPKSQGNPFLDWLYDNFTHPYIRSIQDKEKSASEVVEQESGLNPFDPSSWASLIEDYYEKVEEYNLAAEARANAFSSAEAQKARDWSEFMSSTAYQRAVADLKKAGINPMALFYGRVSPAGNYTSSAASATSHSMAQPNFSAASSVSSSLISAISDVATSLIDALARLIPNFSNSTSNVTSNSTSKSTSNSIVHSWIHKGK